MKTIHAMTERDSFDDEGLSLIELIVGMVVSTIVLVAAGTVLINSWLAQQDVVATTEATNRGQVIASMIERAMRNARDFTVLPDDASGTELRVWTSLPGGLECQGFQLAVPGARFATADGSPLPAASTWVHWQDGVRHLRNDATIAFFVREGDSVNYAFEIYDSAAETAAVQLSGEASKRYEGVEGTSPCW